MNFIFSEEDKEIIGSMRYVDPIGMQPIWHFYARRIIPTLTEQTTTIQGFALFIFCRLLYDKFIEKNDKFIEFVDFFLIIEKLLGISIYKEEQKSWKLRGIEGIFSFLNNNKTEIKQDTKILLNQKGNGTWGLYRGAVLRSNIMNESNELINGFEEFRIINIDVINRLLSEKIKLEKEFITYRIEVKECVTLKESFLKFIKEDKSEFMKKLFDAVLIPPNECKTNFMKELQPKEEGNFSIKGYIDKINTNFYSDYQRITDIIHIENYISYLNNCFYYLLDNYKELKELNDKSILTNIKSKRAKINIEICKGSMAAYRLEIYDKFLINQNHNNIVRALVDIHSEVVKSRKKEPWIVLGEDNNLKLNISRTERINSEQIEEQWNNSYYINSLLSIRAEKNEYGIK